MQKVVSGLSRQVVSQYVKIMYCLLWGSEGGLLIIRKFQGITVYQQKQKKINKNKKNKNKKNKKIKKVWLFLFQLKCILLADIIYTEKSKAEIRLLLQTNKS